MLYDVKKLGLTIYQYFDKTQSLISDYNRGSKVGGMRWYGTSLVRSRPYSSRPYLETKNSQATKLNSVQLNVTVKISQKINPRRLCNGRPILGQTELFCDGGLILKRKTAVAIIGTSSDPVEPAYKIIASLAIRTSRTSATALSSVQDDHAFLWKHAIFRHLPSRNPSTDQNEILHD
jgi:hypothetical protein